jgi:hypothetical protein
MTPTPRKVEINPPPHPINIPLLRTLAPLTSTMLSPAYSSSWLPPTPPIYLYFPICSCDISPPLIHTPHCAPPVTCLPLQAGEVEAQAQTVVGEGNLMAFDDAHTSQGNISPPSPYEHTIIANPCSLAVYPALQCLLVFLAPHTLPISLYFLICS